MINAKVSFKSGTCGIFKFKICEHHQRRRIHPASVWELSRVTHRCCRRRGTQPSRPAGCPESLLCPRRCLPPAGTWAGSRSSSPGCPGCPSWRSANAGTADCKRFLSAGGWAPHSHPRSSCEIHPKSLLSHPLFEGLSWKQSQNLLFLSHWNPLQMPKMCSREGTHPYSPRPPKDNNGDSLDTSGAQQGGNLMSTTGTVIQTRQVINRWKTSLRLSHVGAQQSSSNSGFRRKNSNWRLDLDGMSL